MAVNLDEKSFLEIMETVRHCRMEQLEKEFLDSPGYRKGLASKERITYRMEGLLPDRAKELLKEHGDIYALLMCRVQEHYYGQGFVDCFNLLNRMFFGREEENWMN